jgi:hypothetical protein
MDNSKISPVLADELARFKAESANVISEEHLNRHITNLIGLQRRLIMLRRNRKISDAEETAILKAMGGEA